MSGSAVSDTLQKTWGSLGGSNHQEFPLTDKTHAASIPDRFAVSQSKYIIWTLSALRQLSKTQSKACYISGVQNAIDAASIPLETAFTWQHLRAGMVVKANDAAPPSTSSLFQKAVNLNVAAVLLMTA